MIEIATRLVPDGPRTNTLFGNEYIAFSYDG